MNLSSLSVKRPVTIIMVTLIAILLGSVSLTRLPIDLLPNIEVPVAIVSTSYSGVGPQEIEKLISRPIEEAVATINNIKNVRSISLEGSSIVIAEFNFGTDMDFASLEMREKVDLVKSFIPEDASAPMVLKIDPNAMPILQASLTGGKDLNELEIFAEDIVKPRLERIEGVASVDVTGGYKKQVEITLDQQRLQGYGLSVDYIAQIIGAENLNLPGGAVRKGNQELTIRTIGEFESIDEIKLLPIPLKTGGVVRLNDIADVRLNNKDVSTINKINGLRSINLAVQKQSGTNTVQVANLINKEMDRIRTEYPNIMLQTVVDQSEYVKLAISSVFKDAVFGAILAIGILYIFLKNFRTTLIIGTSIPVSIIVTFILLFINKITLNLMTLGGLALGVGMLVDNAIVVLENIYRFRQEGYSRKDAAIKGASEVGMAVTASTLTTVAVFLPIVFVEGITSTIFRQLALTVTMSLLASLIVSLTLIPMLSSKILKVNRKENQYEGSFIIFRKLYIGFDKVFDGVIRIYNKTLEWSLNHRKLTVLLGIVVFIASMATLLSVGTEFFPEFDEGQFNINISLPEGAELEQTSSVVSEIEGILENVKDINLAFSDIGNAGGFNISGRGSNRATIYVIAEKLTNRDRSTSQIADEVRSLVRDIPGAEIKVEVASMTMSSGGFGGSPISIKVKGDDLGTLKKISDDIKLIIESVPGTKEVESNIGEGIPEVQIKVNRNNASQYGLSAAQIANSVKGIISGRVATRYKLEGDELDVVIKGDETLRKSISNLEQLYIQTPIGINVPLSQVADVQIARGPTSINREGQERVISIDGQILGRDLGSISKDIENKLKSYEIPRGYTYEIGGQNKELNDAFKDLSLALILAIILVYMILASQFESLLHPFVIMFSVPLAFAGGALGLFATQRALSVPAIIGVIILSGIVVNDSIVLVDYINTRRSFGEDRNQAILNAGPIRLRPILMTTLTTVLGLIPMTIGLGEGSEALAPMGAVVIGGMSLATVLILVFIPVVYTLFDDLAIKIKGKIHRTGII